MCENFNSTSIAIKIKCFFYVSLLFLILSIHVFSQDEIKLDSVLSQLKLELVQPGTVFTNDKELFFIKGLVGF
jgi:hypothetical protein